MAPPRDEGLLRSDLPRDTAPRISGDDLAAQVAGNRSFAAALYGQIRTEPGYLFLSPHSISTALAMAYAGARGDTATGMADAMSFVLPGDGVHRAFNRLDLELASRATAATGDTKPFRLVPVNAMWGAKQLTFEPAYLDTLAVHYGAGLRPLDFRADYNAARETINQWVEDRTEGRIQDLLGPLDVDPGTPLVLTNAIYFSAAWRTPFEEENTAAAPFATAGGTVQVPTLHGTSSMGYGETATYRAVEIPYDGGQVSMVVVVPVAAGADALGELEAGLDGDALAAITGSIQPARVALKLPTFSFDDRFELGPPLIALGMGVAFGVGGSADFSGIAPIGMTIAKVIHQTFVSIDEAGTEAAAATAVIFEPPSAPPPPIDVAIDRPFLFFIRDIPTGEILFLGRVVDPRS